LALRSLRVFVQRSVDLFTRADESLFCQSCDTIAPTSLCEVFLRFWVRLRAHAQVRYLCAALLWQTETGAKNTVKLLCLPTNTWGIAVTIVMFAEKRRALRGSFHGFSAMSSG
jgi:hypothetical protein